MFHTGDLNSGISLAIQQSKLVACFIASPTPLSDPEAARASIAWEDEWLPELEEVIEEKAVLLRIEYGSKEAGFLGAFCAIDDAPMLIVIRNGQALEKLERGLEREQWVERLLKALGVEDGDAEEGAQPTQAETAAPEAVVAQEQSSQIPPQPPQPSQPSQPSQSPSNLFPDRAARLEADKARREAAEKAARDARTAARKKEAEEAYEHHKGEKGKQRATSEGTEKSKAREQWIYQQKQRKEEAKREKQRILAQIENDKQERRNRAQRAKDAAAGAEGESSPLPEARVAGQRRSAGAGGQCQLLVRLFDGSSIRGRFSTSAKLGEEVRAWVKQEAPEGSGGADIPYTFRQILAPQPSRSIEVSEEHDTLADLDLVPNATLVLVPVAGSVDAYAQQNSSYLGWASGLLSSAYTGVSYFLPSFSRVYLGGTSDPQEAGNVEGAARAGTDTQLAAASGEAGSGAASVRVKTLADQRAEAANREKGAEFYNGNSLGTVPRKDEEDQDHKGD